MKMIKHALTAFAATTLAANAAVIIDSTGDNINQANLTATTGQTFTTGTLGTENQLATIVLAGPSSKPSGVTFIGIEISINGGAQTVWSPGTALGEVGQRETFPGGSTYDFTSLNIMLLDNTVYALRFTDGAGTSLNSVRLGLSNGPTAGTGGAAPGAFANGTLFSNSATVFSDGFDSAIKVTTVPEPSSTALLGLGALALLRRRRA